MVMTERDGPAGSPGMSRRAALRTGVYGSAAVVAGGLGIGAAAQPGTRGTGTQAAEQPGTWGTGTQAAAQAGTRGTGTQAAAQATRVYDFNQGWLFGGKYTAGA